jgi:multidrug resistance efflux pump
MPRIKAFSRGAEISQLLSELEHTQGDLLIPNGRSSRAAATEDVGINRCSNADKLLGGANSMANTNAIPRTDALPAPSSSSRTPATGSRGLAVSRNRLVRIVLGICLLAAAGAIYVPDILFATSSEAIVNARIVTLAAPIDGRAIEAPPPEGTVVAAAAPLLTIENPTVDRSRLQDLESTRTKTRADLTGVKRLAATLTTQLGTLDNQMVAYQAATVSRLQLAARESEAEAMAARATAAEARADLERKRLLGAKEYVSRAVLDRAEQAAVRAEADSERAELAARRTAQELDAAQRRIYVAHDRNDVPYSQQRTDELLVRIAEASAQEATLSARLTQLDEQVAEETARAASLAHAEVRAPMPGVVWRPLVAAGSTVARDAELMTLIDCSNLYVTASFSARHFDDLRPGGHTIVRLLSSDARYAGTVVDVRAMQRSAAEERFAAPLPKLDGSQILAIIRLDEPKTLASEKYCNVGRRVEVRFADLGTAEAVTAIEPASSTHVE